MSTKRVTSVQQNETTDIDDSSILMNNTSDEYFMTSLMDNTEYSNDETNHIENNLSIRSKGSSLTLLETHNDQSIENTNDYIHSTLESFTNSKTQTRHDLTEYHHNTDCKFDKHTFIQSNTIE